MTTEYKTCKTCKWYDPFLCREPAYRATKKANCNIGGVLTKWEPMEQPDNVQGKGGVKSEGL